MIRKKTVHDIKREQRKSFYLRELSQLLYTLTQDVPALGSLFLTRVDLSADGGICYLYFSALPTPESDSPGQIFEKVLPQLKLYKPGLRTALAKLSTKRYTPDLIFLFDEKKEKIDKMNELLDKVQEGLNDEKKEL